MKPVSSAAEVRELDRRVIEELGLPGVALMEVAARGVADAVRAHHLAEARRGTVVACGSGNNGGDGWAVARWLHGWGLPVAVWALGEPPAGGDAATMAAVCRRLGVAEVDGPGDAGLLVDAVFGTGLDREVTGRYADALRALDAHSAPVVAVDLPSGLDADRGAVLGVCPAAARTVTFGRAKTGLFAGEGPDRCGVIDVVDIGLEVGATEAPAAELVEPGDLVWPRRAASAHKGSSGRLLVVAGSAAMTGAAVLCCLGALAGGAGLVTLLAPAGARGRLAALPPEVMLLDGGPADLVDALPDISAFDAVAAGPGLGAGRALSNGLAASLSALWREDPRPLVFDADALPCTGAPISSAPRVLTPHPGEAGRMLGISAHQVEGDRFSTVSRLAERGVALLKGRFTLVADGRAPISINGSGAPTLASGGTGDVLTGLIGAFLARGVGARDAARLAAWAHGRAGEVLAARRPEGWTASDVAAVLPTVMG